MRFFWQKDFLRTRENIFGLIRFFTGIRARQIIIFMEPK